MTAEPLPADAQPGVTVVIPSHNRPQLLIETVRSILAGGSVPSEIVIVDQSDEPHPQLPGFTSPGTRVQYTLSSRRGLSRGRNDGIATASHELLVFVDDDMLVDSGWLQSMTDELRRRGPEWIVTGQVREAGGGDGAFAPSSVVDPQPREYRGRQLLDVLYAGNMGFHRALVDRIGGFDERLGAGSRFPGAEDNDFAYRLLQAGGGIAYLPAAAVDHRAWRGSGDYLPLRRAYGRGQGAFYAKHLLRGDLFAACRWLWLLIHYARRLPGRLRREPERARGDLAYLAAMLAGAAGWVLSEGRRPDPSASPPPGSGAS